MTPKRYALEIYLPNNPGYDVACLLESDEPFLPIHKGDLINPATWTSHYVQNFNLFTKTEPNQFILRVTGIEHFLCQREEGMGPHKIGIFTELVKNEAESRI
jgi:hypothetical protein